MTRLDLILAIIFGTTIGAGISFWYSISTWGFQMEQVQIHAQSYQDSPTNDSF